MADSDFNSLKPVESLHNVHGLTPAQERKQRRRRQDPQAEPQEAPEQQEQNEQEQNEQEQSDVKASDEGKSHSIDYCA